MATRTRPSLTDEQREALQCRDVSVALSAGAGCGKTFVLTERFLSHLEPARGEEPPAQLPELVAITFTERAAREMRDRIRRKCHERLLAAADDQQAEHWLRLLRQLDAARVSTIHSFCASLLRAHAVEAGLDPHFQTLEAGQAATLLAELVDDQLREQVAQRQPAAIDLMVKFGLDSVRSMLRELFKRSLEIDFDGWLALEPQAIAARWAEFHRGEVVPVLLRRLAGSAWARRLLEIGAEHPPDNETLQENLHTLAAILPRLFKSRDLAGDLQRARDATIVQRVKGIRRAWADAAIYDDFKEAAQALRADIDGARKLISFDEEAALPMAIAGRQLLEIAAPMAEAYKQRKQELALLDFDDLLLRARDLLVGPGRQRLRRQIAAQVKLLLVDEFQDTDPLQVELVRALCDGDVAGGKLFFVGDYKQSIYRFRRADPQVFRALSDSIPGRGRLPLSENFRSQPAILDFVNALFCEELAREAQPYERLQPRRPQLGPTPAVEFLWSPAEHAKEPVREMRRREAEWIARRLRELLDGGEPLVVDRQAGEAALRAVQPGDIALLFRALSDVDCYEEALRRHGIDYYLVGGHAFYAQQEIFDLVNLLRALVSPCDEVSLAGVLRSPFFALADETLFWLAQQRGGLAAGLFAAELPADVSPEERRRARFAAATLDELRKKKDRLTIAQLINEALARTGYDAALLAEFLGERKLANLRKLIDRARSFDRSAVFTLNDFLTELSEFIAQQPDEPLAPVHPESSNVVRLMTIHAAKGLEFPVVVVPDLDRKPHAGGRAAVFHCELGPLVKSRDLEGPCGMDLYNAIELEEECAERARLLYVATTRAADYLILSACVKKFDQPQGAGLELLARRFDVQTGQLRGALPAGWPVPEVRVTTHEPPEPAAPVSRRPRPDVSEAAARAAQLAIAGDVRLAPGAGPVPVDAAARRHYSFSRLSGQLRSARPYRSTVEDETALPAQVDPLDLGTLVHAVLAEIDFARPAAVEPLLERHAERHLPGQPRQREEAGRLVAGFLESPRAAQLARARQRFSELEFLLAWPPEGGGEGRYLHGFIDCLYEDEEGRWQIVDYKTNRVDASNLDEVAAHYEMQMLVYGLAAEQVLKQPVESLVLHFLRGGQERHFRLDAAGRKKLGELVEQAISRLIEAETAAA